LNGFARGSLTSTSSDILLLHLKPQLFCTFVLLHPYGYAECLMHCRYWNLGVLRVCADDQNAHMPLQL